MTLGRIGCCFLDDLMIPLKEDGSPAKLPPVKRFDLVRRKVEELADATSYQEHILPEHTPISNQGSMGSCVANAWCDALEMLDGMEQGDAVEQLSRMFLYAVSRILHKALGEDRGTYNRAAAHQLTTLGTVEERYYPYRSKYLHVPPPADLYTMASNHRITDAYSITSVDTARAEDIELALLAGHPVIFGTPVGSEFHRYRGEDKVLHPTQSWSGRHAMIVTGVRHKDGERHFLWRNSWGLDWGKDGHVWVSESYMTWDQTKDLWVPTTQVDWS